MTSKEEQEIAESNVIEAAKDVVRAIETFEHLVCGVNQAFFKKIDSWWGGVYVAQTAKEHLAFVIHRAEISKRVELKDRGETVED